MGEAGETEQQHHHQWTMALKVIMIMEIVKEEVGAIVGEVTEATGEEAEAIEEDEVVMSPEEGQRRAHKI